MTRLFSTGTKVGQTPRRAGRMKRHEAAGLGGRRWR